MLVTPTIFSCLLLFANSCNDDDKPKTIPQVTTFAATDITTTSALLHGEITDDGNAKITESGFVYSTVVDEPTVADTKVVVEADDDDQLESLLEGLTSGTTYHIRAFATNSKGTAYSEEAIDFETGNAAPDATEVTIDGAAELNGTLTASYAYEDAEGDEEGTSILQWYVDDDGVVGGETAINGANALTFKIPNEEAYQGKYITFGVTPKAATGTNTGMEVRATFTAGIGEATTVTFTYMGNEVTYGIINSSVTGKKWLDRNLGAPNTPTAYDDFANYGDLFQWGRDDDGHQVVTRPSGVRSTWVGTVRSGTSSSPNAPGWVNTNTPGHANFICVSEAWDANDPWDWRIGQNENLWQGVNGINNPCPTGWRIPTKADFEAETLTAGPMAYSQLKLTKTGRRSASGGNSGNPAGGFIDDAGGRYWTSTSVLLDYSPNVGGKGSHVFEVGDIAAGFFGGGFIAIRANGIAVRCIRD